MTVVGTDSSSSLTKIMVVSGSPRICVVAEERLHVLVIGECVATWLGDGAESVGWSHDFL